MAHKLSLNGYLIGLDIGDKRIGLARASAIAKIPEPIETIENNDLVVEKLKTVIQRERASLLVVGIPRNLQGQETAQSQKIRAQVQEWSAQINIEVVFVDESLSSVRADDYLANSKGRQASQDSVAACFILQEFFIVAESISEDS